MEEENFQTQEDMNNLVNWVGKGTGQDNWGGQEDQQIKNAKGCFILLSNI